MVSRVPWVTVVLGGISRGAVFDVLWGTGGLNGMSHGNFVGSYGLDLQINMCIHLLGVNNLDLDLYHQVTAEVVVAVLVSVHMSSDLDLYHQVTADLDLDLYHQVTAEVAVRLSVHRSRGEAEATGTARVSFCPWTLD